MAGTPYPLDKTLFSRGPGKVYVGVAVPAVGSELVLATDGTPDATANPNALAIGATEAGAKFTAKPLFETEQINEVAGDFDRAIIGWEMSISGIYRQVRDYPLEVAITPGATAANTAASTGVKGKKKTLFGLGTTTLYSVTLIAKIPNSSPALYEVYQLYSSLNEAGIEREIDRTKGARNPFNFKAYPVPTRDESDMYGTHWEQTAAL
jgi:hypothetical protein